MTITELSIKRPAFITIVFVALAVLCREGGIEVVDLAETVAAQRE